MAVNTFAATGVLLGGVALVAFALLDTRARWQRRRGWDVPLQKHRSAQRSQGREWDDFSKRQRAKAKATKAAKTK